MHRVYIRIVMQTTWNGMTNTGSRKYITIIHTDIFCMFLFFLWEVPYKYWRTRIIHWETDHLLRCLRFVFQCYFPLWSSQQYCRFRHNANLRSTGAKTHKSIKKNFAFYFFIFHIFKYTIVMTTWVMERLSVNKYKF